MRALTAPCSKRGAIEVGFERTLNLASVRPDLFAEKSKDYAATVEYDETFHVSQLCGVAGCGYALSARMAGKVLDETRSVHPDVAQWYHGRAHQPMSDVVVVVDHTDKHLETLKEMVSTAEELKKVQLLLQRPA